MSHACSGTAAAVRAHPVPNLFATTSRADVRSDVRILDELSAGRRMAAGGKRVLMVLVLGVGLAVVSVLTMLWWDGGRATFGIDEAADGVEVSVPVVTGGREEPVPAMPVLAPPVQEVLAPAATIVEIPVPGVEASGGAIRRSEGAGVDPARGRLVKGVGRGTNARGAHGAAVREGAARSQSKRGDVPRSSARHTVSQGQRQPAVTKNVEEWVDADVQVIEAIVTRPR